MCHKCQLRINRTTWTSTSQLRLRFAATPGWGGEIFYFGDEQNDEDSTNGCGFCVSVLHMSRLKGSVAAGVCVRLSRSNKSPAKVGSF